MRAGTIRKAIIILMALELFYMSLWIMLFFVVRTGLWSQDWFGFDGDNVVNAANDIQIFMTFLVPSLILLSLLLIIRFSKYTIYAYFLSVIAHFTTWISLLDNEYYNGTMGFFVIMVEAAITILLLNLPKKNYLK